VAGRRTLGSVDVEAVTDRTERNVAVKRGDGTSEGCGWWWAVFCEGKSIKDAASTKTTRTLAWVAVSALDTLSKRRSEEEADAGDSENV
jgi:hypothetical protein